MKKLLVLCVAISLFSCRQGDPVEKPEKLISQEEMTNILYDMSLLQAMRSQSQKDFKESGIEPKAYIFEKYKIDSITLAQNHRYYASKLDVYEKIQKEVKQKLEAEKAKVSPPPAEQKEQTLPAGTKQ